MEKNCLNCRYGNYWREGRVICFMYDDLTVENDCCGLWRDGDGTNTINR